MYNIIVSQSFMKIPQRIKRTKHDLKEMRWPTELPYSSRCGVRVYFSSDQIEFMAGEELMFIITSVEENSEFFLSTNSCFPVFPCDAE